MALSSPLLERAGAVVIGRNEGERLRICLHSLIRSIKHIVYVDSGSTDNSVGLASQLNVKIVQLDMSKPFTAARARNAGFKSLLSDSPGLEYVQFIDGDCQLDPNWLEAGGAYLDGHPDSAIVFGRLRERFPENSIYNKLCDIEWNVPSGSSHSCGGIALIRAGAFQQVNGFHESLIAGEEPDLCFRLREKKWNVYRLDAEMAQHDAAILHFYQWWRRTKRGGFAYAEGSYLNGNSPEKYWVRETRSIFFWGGLLPVIIILTGLMFSPWFFLGGLVYVIQALKIAWFKRKEVDSWSTALAYGFFTIAGKLPQFIGALRFYMTKLFSHDAQIIEYK